MVEAKMESKIVESKTVESKTLVVIPTYNAEKFIARSLKSCVKQTIPTRIYVVDNCSTDKTREIVADFQKEHPLLELFTNETNLGRIGNWNRCLELFEASRYEYIKFIFAGDEIFPRCIEEVESVFIKDKEIGVVLWSYEFVNSRNQVFIKSHYSQDVLLETNEITRINIEKAGILGAIIANTYAKSVIKGIRFNPAFIGKADFDFQVLSKGKVYFLNKVLSRFNLDCHSTFGKSLDYVTELEVGLTRARLLEKVRSSFSEKDYTTLREKILVDTIFDCIKYFRISFITKLIFRLKMDAVALAYHRLKWKIISLFNERNNQDKEKIISKEKNNQERKNKHE